MGKSNKTEINVPGKKKVAVAGGGIFGTTAAIYAARDGHEVHLFEALDDVLQAASGINQYRLHRGYHYPRSPETILSAMRSEELFRDEYESAVISDGKNIYAIAREGSKTNTEQFLAVCDRYGLAYRAINPDGILDPTAIDGCFEAEESWYDPKELKRLIKEKLRDSGVSVHLSTAVTDEKLEDFDHVVIATYANPNAPLGSTVSDSAREEYQFELCEKPVVALPEQFGNTGVVVLDGPFMCVDPMGRTGRYVLGNVVHAIHRSSVGYEPDIPDEYREYLNQGIIKNPRKTKFSKFIESGSRFIPTLKEARHIGSMFTIRTVLPNVDDTDERPTIVKAIDDRHTRIFSGKVGNCVEAAHDVCAILATDGKRPSTHYRMLREEKSNRT